MTRLGIVAPVLLYFMPDGACADKRLAYCQRVFALPECALAFRVLARVAIPAQCQRVEVARLLSHAAISAKANMGDLDRGFRIANDTCVGAHMIAVALRLPAVASALLLAQLTDHARTTANITPQRVQAV
jgi:hypothetical protein